LAPWLAAVFLVAGGCQTERSSRSPKLTISKAKSHFAALGTNRVHYLTVGHGKQVVVFVHGWCGNTQFWREQVPVLADHARLILIDLPGHGQSDKPRVSYTLDYFADAVLAVMADAHLAKATLVGHSMGVPVICRVYARAPEHVAGLVPVDGFLRRPKFNPDQIEQFVGPFRAPEYRDQAKAFVSSMFPNPSTEAVRDWVLDQVLATPQYVMSSALENQFSTNQPTWDLSDVKVPLAAINTQSPMWTPEYQAYVRSLSARVDYLSVTEAGHFLMLEKPAAFNAALLKGLREFALVSD
jgi:pimeloyl-ACP methyl ester carboxylesterase